jgi:hypothetical protein
MPCLMAFCAARALPSEVFGPRDLAPFFRLASARALLTGTAAADAAPPLDMTRFLRTGVGELEDPGTEVHAVSAIMPGRITCASI